MPDAGRERVVRTGGAHPSVTVFSESQGCLFAMVPVAGALVVTAGGTVAAVANGGDVVFGLVATVVLGAALFGMVGFWRRRADRPAVVVDERGVTKHLRGMGRWGLLPWEQITGLRAGGRGANRWLTFEVRDPDRVLAAAGPGSRALMRANGWFLGSPVSIPTGNLPLGPEALAREIRALCPAERPRRVPVRLPVGSEPGADDVVVERRGASVTVSLFPRRVALVPLGAGSPVFWLPVAGLVLFGIQLAAAAGPGSTATTIVVVGVCAAAVLALWALGQLAWWAAVRRHRPVLILDERGIRRTGPGGWSVAWADAVGIRADRVRGVDVVEVYVRGRRTGRRVPLRALPLTVEQLRVAADLAAPPGRRRQR